MSDSRIYKRTSTLWISSGLAASLGPLVAHFSHSWLRDTFIAIGALGVI